MPDTPRPADPDKQLATWREAVEALGGIHATARRLKITERHCARLYSGASPLHDGFLRDMTDALLDQIEHCRVLARRLTPAFVGNLTADQLARMGRPDGRRFDTRENADG